MYIIPGLVVFYIDYVSLRPTPVPLNGACSKIKKWRKTGEQILDAGIRTLYGPPSRREPFCLANSCG